MDVKITTMKYFTILAIIILNYGCNNTDDKQKQVELKQDTVVTRSYHRIKPDTPVFHIKVVNFESCGWFQIIYTNDNFITEEIILNVLDLTAEIEPVHVVIQRRLFTDQGEAVSFAKQFRNYKSCTDYNAMMAKRYSKKIAYYALHPPKKAPQNKCIPNTNILIQ